ncbi:MAG: anti-sigma factor [Myxococcaceae bacterium]
MSGGCDFEALDALAAGELLPARADEVRAHAVRCGRCAHELAWLRSERELFEQRANRELSGAQGVAPGAAPPRASPAGGGPWRLGAWAAAACLLAVVFLQSDRVRRSDGSLGDGGRLAQEWSPGLGGASVDPQWVIASLERQVGACLLATPGEGLFCGRVTPPVPASFGLSGN